MKLITVLLFVEATSAFAQEKSNVTFSVYEAAMKLDASTADPIVLNPPLI